MHTYIRTYVLTCVQSGTQMNTNTFQHKRTEVHDCVNLLDQNSSTVALQYRATPSLHTYMYTFMHAYIHTYMHTYVYTFMHKYTFIRIRIHTYRQTDS